MSARALIFVLVAFLGLGWSHLATAQNGQITVPTSDGEQIEIGTLELKDGLPARGVSLPVGKARLIRLPMEVRDVLVANPATANVVVKTPRLIYLVGLAVGSTNAFFLDADGKELLRLEIQVELDVVSAKQTVKKLLPQTDIKITAVNSHLFLTGSVRSADISENARVIASRFVAEEANVINMLAVIEDQQVLLQVRVAEISRNVLKELGVNLFDAVSGAFSTLTSGDFALRVGSTAPTTDTPFFNAGGSVSSNAGDTLTVAINALERNGLIKTLAEPNLTTISGEPATFLAGGEYPIPVSSSDGDISITQEPFGVALSFTPVVLNSGRISLRIFTEVSALSNNGAITLANIQVPALIVRRAETTVELPSGGSLMIAGLLQESETAGIRGVPGLKDVPILGSFFRNNSVDKSESELIIAVTAYLVKPTVPRKIETAVDGLIPASDYDVFLMGRLQGIYTGGEKTTTASLKGPIGYILE
ncbi:MAG: type II and III secretion system protein family protein [Rhodospirillaceae bacterium]|nr:type II and III secretion system protein family protein [Rhodospirillaceae bacterium]MBT6590179.1 type II and III secretion system protein family protein [Rhodospirillaceae bacterium]MBT7976437.1 type II and III secretion system protein family protein [Rhodospirillaceae bacterium]